jgi:hypothetical protein
MGLGKFADSVTRRLRRGLQGEERLLKNKLAQGCPKFPIFRLLVSRGQIFGRVGGLWRPVKVREPVPNPVGKIPRGALPGDGQTN